MVKKTLVCGYGGIGNAIVKGLLDRNRSVVVISKSSFTKDNIDLFKNNSVEYFNVDITNVDELKKLENTLKDFIIESLVFTSVSKLQRKSILQLSETELKDDFSVTVFGFLNLIKIFGPKIEKNGNGSIAAITTSAIEPNRTVQNLGGYLAAKASLRQILRQLAAEFGPSKIRVNAVAPGFVRTKLNFDLPGKVDTFIKEKNLMNEIVTPEDVASAVVYLVSEESRSITGVSLLLTYGEGMNL
jgi:NAD(P)-dependent dehydrogenase (short-subunit alcohol dehydrogenase family)